MAMQDMVRGVADIWQTLTGTKDQLDISQQILDLEKDNFGWQKLIFGYQQDLQKKIFNREDTAMQRGVEDLKAAGLHPSMAAGGGARAGSAVPISAPQRGVEGQKAKMQAYEKMASVASAGMTIAELGAIGAQTRKTNAEADYLERTTPAKSAMIAEQLQAEINNNKQFAATFEAIVKSTKAEADSKEFQATIDRIGRDQWATWENWFKENYTYMDGNTRRVKENGIQYVPQIAASILDKIQAVANQHNLNLGVEQQTPVGQQTDWRKVLGKYLSAFLKGMERR